ncbi:putative exosortase B-associated extracellular polysaccharide biosynthesis transporter EpsL [Nitrosospira lacus]|uniref:Putative exosortase B-associated extracellular polysaccharide biosynthesis transporter EpsL n=1 Tax=Nitrosospira lacus TaxID=1288494 RepID=A0A1W6SLA0_9PROT|nr:XrtB/PEP-CTERM-associated polysaccharide biosynthesis outer membrane protein EpsL [Nitrosospira lacus]ARO86563.1 putative exosortase B-associated extracellular polysaccharide biosynthesis transporter EpsL [Nitrosospira lacus]
MLLLNLSRCNRPWLAIAAFILLPLTVQYASADAGDTFNVTASSMLMYDSNVFRLSPLVNPVTLLGQPSRSDQIVTSSVALSVNKLYSMQRFEFNGSIVDNRYNTFDFLNFIGKNYTAAWHWYLTPYLHGKLSSGHREVLNNFADLTGFANSTNRNLRTDDNIRFDGVFEINGGWRIIGGISQDTRKNSRLTVQDFDNRVRSVEGGIRYDFPSGSSLTYKVRSGLGEFFKRPQPLSSELFDTRFDELEHEVRLAWFITGKTSIDARAGHLERNHAHFPQRDFSGFVGNFNLNWAPTAKTRISMSWARELSNFQTASAFQLSQFQRFSSSYIATNRFSLSPVWQITDKTALRMRYDFIVRDFLGAVISLPADRSDTMHSGLIALDWKPLNMLSMSAVFQRDHRSSSLTGFDFDSTAGSVTARLSF